MKLNPRVKSVIPEAGHRLRLTFANGEERIYDVSPLLDEGVFLELQDESAFRSVHPWHGTVQWAGGQDICPDTLYEDSVPIEMAEPAMVREPHADYGAQKSPVPRKSNSHQRSAGSVTNPSAENTKVVKERRQAYRVSGKTKQRRTK